MYAFRQAELVGKRFLCVKEKNSLRPNSRSSRVSNPLDYQWKVGVIRACSEQDLHHPELKVLVEYDNEDWTTREWLTIYDGSWKIFMVEKTMVWSQRPDPSNPRRPLLWPALTFSPLVDKHGLNEEDRPIPVEFVGDHERVFLRNDEFRPYGQDDDALQPVLRNNPVVMEELRNWQRLQKSQSILLDGPYTLTGFRVKVYRQNCRQWFSAVITAHDLMSRELSCMDDTVLQTHRVNPRLVQVILLANETELDSLLRGELVRVLPIRKHRHSQVIITAPLTTQTTTSSLSSNAPTTWQLYSGLTQASNSNNLVSSTQSAYSSPVVSTVTTRHTAACSPPNPRQSTSTSKERRKSSETRNRSSASRRVTRSDSANSPASSSGTHTQAPQTIQSSLTSSSATPMTSSPRTVSHASSLLSHKTSPPEACTLSPKNSSTLGSMGSPSSSLPKKSPIKQPVSPNTSQPMLQYSSSPISKASMSSMGSPFRSNPFCSSPDMSSVPSMASPMSGMSHMGMCSPGHAGYPRPQSPHPLYSHTMGRLNISPSQLYALQLQQQQQQMQSPEQQEFLTKLQHQHYESLLHQYQMHHYQLQLMLQQQELIQQMPLTLEQQHILAEHYNQLLHQYQCAQIVQQLAAVTQEEQLSMFHPTDERTQVLPEVIQQQLREAQERQKEELQNLMPRLEPEQLQRVFTCLQQRNMTSEQLKQLYTLLIQQQEAHRGPPQEDEEQKQKIQEYLRQNQEHVQKILQLQQSPSFAQDVLHKQEPNQGASSSSSQQESPSSSSLKPSSSSFPPSSSSFPPSTSSFPPSSSSFPPSSSSSSSSSFPPSSSASASSSSSFPPSSSSFPPSSFPPSSSSSFPPSSSAFTVHHLPTPSDSAASTDANSKDKPDSDLHLESSTSEGTKHQASLHADEIELTSTTTEGERSSSPHAILEKLLQHHLQAVEESKHQAPAKTRKARTSSTEKKSKRQRKSAESSSSTRTQTKENSALGKDSQKIKTSALVPDSSTGNPFLSALAGSASRMQEPMDASVIQNFSENEKDSVNKHKLPRNFGVVDSQPSEAESQRKAEVDNTVSSVAGQRYSLVREDSPQKTTPKVPTGDVEKGAPPEGVKLRGSEDTQNEGPSVSANINGSTDMSEGNLQVLGKEKTPTLVKKCSEKVDVVAEEPETSELRSLLEKTSSILPEKETTFSKNVSAEGIIAEKPKKTSSIAPEKEDTKCSKNVSAKGIIAEKPKKTSSIAPEKEDTKRSKNVSAKGIIAEKPKKTSSIAPQKDETKRSKNVSAEGIIAEKPKKTSSIAPQKDETKRSKNVSAKGISAEQPKMSLLDKTCSVALEKEGTNCSENVSAKVIIAKKTKRRILDKTSSTAPDKEDSKCSENVSSNDIISGKPKTTLLDKTSSTAPEKEEINGSENVLAKGVIAEELKTSEFRSMLEKTSSTVPAKEGTETSNSKCNEQEWVELTTLKGVKKPSVNLTVKELSKSPSANLTVRELSKSPSAKLTVKELSKSPSAKLTVKLSKSPSAKLTVQELSKSPQSHLLKNSVHEAAKPSANVSKNQLTHSQDIVSNAMVVDTPVVSQKASLSSEAKTLSTNCFSFLSSNSADHNGELFAELKTYSKRITPKKRKSSSSPKESIVEENSVVSKVLKMESSEVDPKKITVGKKLLESQVEHKPVKRQHQNSLSSGVKGKISRKKLTGENKLQVKKIKCEENNCDNTSADAIQDKPRLELRDQESCVVDSVSFVADQAVKDVTINHSPTMKDAPRGQLDVGQPNFDYLHDRSKERIREMTRKKKKLKAKEEKRKERKNASAVSTTIVKKETVEGESLETVVDSVLDEEIVVIYNGEEHQENRDVNSSEIKKEDVTSEAVIEAVKKPPVKGRKKVESAMKDVVKGRKRKAKKLSDSDGDTVSPNSEQFFLQDRVCAKFSHLPMCRECRDVHGEKTGLEFCRFNLFRRLKKRKNGKVLVAGFQLPEHAANEDFCPWIAQDQVDRMDKMTSLYVLSNVGDQFCSVMQEEKKAITLAGENVSVAYKRAVQGVREMCDVCATTIFNMHWVCHRCGFGVCLDCYNLRVKERNEQPVTVGNCDRLASCDYSQSSRKRTPSRSSLAGKRVFEFKWFMCCPGICHQPKYLSVAQIIPKTVLSELGDELHRVREVWDIGKTCPCKSFVSNEGNESGAKITELSNDEMDTTDGKEQRNEPNNSCAGGKEEACEVTVKTETATAPVASCPVNQNLAAMDSESSLEGSDDVNLICDESLGVDSPTNHEQEWLTEEKRRNHFTKKAGFGLVEAKPRQAKGMSSGLSLLMDYTSSTEGSPCDSPANNDVKPKVGAFNFSFSSGLDLLVLACEGKEGLPIPSSVNWDNGSKKEAEKSKPEPQNKQKDSEIRNVSLPVATPSECTSAQCSDEVRQATPMVPDSSVLDSLTDAPHSWLCDGRLLRLHEPRAPGNLKSFAERWKKGEPVLVSHVDKYLNLDIWTPKAFGEEFGSEIADVVNCRNGVVIEKFKVGDFWEGFESIKDRPLDSNDEPMLLKLKDWPPKDDFSEKLPTRFEDLMNNVPLPEYTRRDGSRNLVSRLPEFFVTPDLGPKMYNAYGSAACPKEGTTNLHLDMSDAVNVMVYVGVPKDHGAGEKERKDAIKAVDEACDESQRIRVRQETTRIGALWHIYTAEDADKIRDCLREVAKERKSKHPSHHDPIHDQCFYLDHDIRQRLKKDYGVEGWAICQCLGDAVFIPAGAPHQVRNLYSCIKVAEDFVSPERIDHCFQMTQEFRHLSDKHTNHEDKLQVKNIIYHAVKDALNSLKHHEQELNSNKQHR